MKTRLLGRFLIDYENPDAGIGHSLGYINNAYKTCLRNNLTFAFSEKQLFKSTASNWKWRLKQIKRVLTGRKPYETHNLGNSINELFKFDFQEKITREYVELLLKKGSLKLIHLPEPAIEIPSNLQNDDVAYREIDEVINKNPEDGIVFMLPNKRTGDFEYQNTREWFKKCYANARSLHPIDLSYKNDALNVAIHIRRGDLLPGRQYSDLSKRMLPDSWYIDIVEKILQVTDKKVSLVILSEGINGKYCSELGTPFSWKNNFESSRIAVTEMIDAPFNESFHQMQSADILIGSKSGMSHLAGILNNGIKIMPKMWHSYRGCNLVLEIEDCKLTDRLSEIESLLLSGLH